MLVLFPTYIWSMNADIIHQMILSYQVRVTLGKDLKFTSGELTHGHSFYYYVLDITRKGGSNENI